MKNFVGATILALSSVLAACGGGGGSSGDSNLPYSITLTAAKTQLPINIANEGASIGAYAKYTTTLYVNAREGGAPIPGGEDIFSCNISQGLDSGALYYLDGKSEHEDENKNPLAYRSITLGANSGGNSFHFHSGNKAGVAHITCTVTNPADKLVSSASVDIVVGAETGRPASVIATAQAPGYLGSRDNLNLIRNNVGIQAFLMDDANQPIPEPGAANLQVSIRPGGASSGARLLSGSQSASVLQVRTVGGVGLVSLSSGPDSGTILLEFATDRFDNNVSNGIQDPVLSLYAVSVVDILSAGAPSVTTSTLAAGQEGVSYAFALEAEGGLPPYSWSVTGALPNGLTLTNSGILQGTPSSAGTYNLVITVRDSTGATSSRNLSMVVEKADVPDVPTTPTTPEQAPLVVTGCTGSAEGACKVPDAAAGVPYVYAFSASGGDTTKPVTWDFTAAPAWLTTGQVGNNGVVNGTPPNPTLASECLVKFVVTATRGSLSQSRQVDMKVTGGVCPL